MMNHELQMIITNHK